MVKTNLEKKLDEVLEQLADLNGKFDEIKQKKIDSFNTRLTKVEN